MKPAYLALCVVGTAVPYAAFVPCLVALPSELRTVATRSAIAWSMC